MQQLSAHDAAFLDGDTAHANANVSLLHIYDQRTAPGGVVRFKTLLEHIESRLGASPLFRRRLVQVPLGLDRPYWIDDEHFDLEYHVRHIALPKPGDWRQFCIQVSRIHARPLDLQRPLWEVYVIEGLDGFRDLPAGSFALLAKTHHAAVDVERDNEWTMRLHDLSPAPPPRAPARPWFPEPPPALLPLMCRGVLRTIARPARAAAPLVRTLRRAAPDGLALAGQMLRRDEDMPVVRFNAVVSPHRVFETRRFASDDVRRIRALVRGAGVHDVALAVCGGALRRYLGEHDELPAASLVALTPRSACGRGAGNADASQLAWQRVPLGTDIADPVQRLRAIRVRRARAEAPSGAGEQRGEGQRSAAASLVQTARQLAASLAGPRRTPLANCTVTSVPGPERPLYLCGARMTYFSALLPVADGMGLTIAVTSHDGRLIVSPTSCRELMPDPERFARCLRESFEELLALAGVSKPVGVAA